MPNTRCQCRGKGAPVIIDPCIRELVDTLNRHGIKTFGSCCGHGAAEGFVLVEARAVHAWRDGILRLRLVKQKIRIPYDTKTDTWVDEDPQWPAGQLEGGDP